MFESCRGRNSLWLRREPDDVIDDVLREVFDRQAHRLGASMHLHERFIHIAAGLDGHHALGEMHPQAVSVGHPVIFGTESPSQ
jgi:hypothetical protein